MIKIEIAHDAGTHTVYGLFVGAGVQQHLRAFRVAGRGGSNERRGEVLRARNSIEDWKSCSCEKHQSGIAIWTKLTLALNSVKRTCANLHVRADTNIIATNCIHIRAGAHQ